VNQYLGSLRDAIGRGAHVRLLCPDPADEAVIRFSLFRSVFRTEPTHVTSDVLAHIEFARSLRKEGVPFDIYTVPYLPPYGIIRITDGAGHDVLHVKLMAFKVGAGNFPVFTLTRNSGEWFEFFAEQLELYFATGRPYPNPQKA